MRRRGKQVYMIGHEHPTVNRNSESLSALCQPVRIGRQIMIAGKYGVPVIAPLDEVDGKAGGTESGSSLALSPLGATAEGPILMISAVLKRWGLTVTGSEIIPSLAVGLLCPFTLTP